MANYGREEKKKKKKKSKKSSRDCEGGAKRQKIE
jgi:hypothetical protein